MLEARLSSQNKTNTRAKHKTGNVEICAVVLAKWNSPSDRRKFAHTDTQSVCRSADTGKVFLNCCVYVLISYRVPGLRKEQVLPLVQPQYGSLEARQLLKTHTQNVTNQTL